MLKRQAEQGESVEIDKEQIIRGMNLYLVDPKNLLQGDSDNDDISANFDMDKNFEIINSSNVSESSQ